MVLVSVVGDILKLSTSRAVSNLSLFLPTVAESAFLKSNIRDSVQDLIQHNNDPATRRRRVRHWWYRTCVINVQNAAVESTSIVGTIEAMNLRNTTR